MFYFYFLLSITFAFFDFSPSVHFLVSIKITIKLHYREGLGITEYDLFHLFPFNLFFVLLVHS
jgi:hypothetical protein